MNAAILPPPAHVLPGQTPTRRDPRNLAVYGIAAAALLSFGYCYGYAIVIGGDASLLTSLGWMLADWAAWLALAPWLAAAGARAAHLPAGEALPRLLREVALAVLLAMLARTVIDIAGADLALAPLLYKRLPVFLVIAALALAVGYWTARPALTRLVPVAVPVRDERCLPVQSARGEHVLPVSAISSLEACGNYIEVRAGAATYLMRTTMKALDDQLAGTSLVRCHRSFFVNLSKVVRMEYRHTGNHVLVLAGGETVPVSKSCRDSVREALGRIGGTAPADIAA